MKSLKFISTFFFLIIGFSFPSVNSMNSEEIYYLIQLKEKMMIPNQFSASLHSSLIRAQIRRIPKKSVQFEKTPKAILSYHKGIGFKIKIINVNEYYQHALSIYEDTLSKTGLYLTVGNYNSYKKFSTRFSLKILNSNETSFLIYVKDHESLKGDYAHFIFNKDWLLQKSIYFEQDNPSATAIFSYTRVSDSFIVNKINVIFEKNKKNNTILELKNFTLK